jgi:pilus assembly protein Flp/PilA
MRATFRQFLTDESGATAIEYGLIAAGISVAIIAVVNNLGTKLHTTFSSISTQMKLRQFQLAVSRAKTPDQRWPEFGVARPELQIVKPR